MKEDDRCAYQICEVEFFALVPARNAPLEFLSGASSGLFLAIGKDARRLRIPSFTSEWGSCAV